MSCKKSKFKIGDKVEVVNNTARHNQPIGSKGTVSETSYGENFQLEETGTLWYNHTDLKLITKFKKECIKNKINCLEKQLECWKNKLTWMEETGAEFFDEDEWKIYKAISVMEEQNVSRMDKAKEISKLLKNCCG